MGYPVYRIEQGREGGTAAYSDLESHIAARTSRTMYYAKVDTRDIVAVRALSALGFYVVDVNVTLGIDRGAVPSVAIPPVPAGVTVSDCDATTAPAALAIAGSAMRYSRFHLDPGIPNDMAHRIKHDWIQNYVRGIRGEALMVARADGHVAGFLAVLASDAPDGRVRTIDLIAVDSAHQRRGVGRALVTAFIERYAPSSARLQVGTQVANTPSLKLYQGLGFAVRQTAYVLHLHTPASPTAAA